MTLETSEIVSRWFAFVELNHLAWWRQAHRIIQTENAVTGVSLQSCSRGNCGLLHAASQTRERLTGNTNQATQIWIRQDHHQKSFFFSRSDWGWILKWYIVDFTQSICFCRWRAEVRLWMESEKMFGAPAASASVCTAGSIRFTVGVGSWGTFGWSDIIKLQTTLDQT